MDEVKFVEDSHKKIWIGMVCLKQTIPLQIFKGCLPQILIDPFLNTLTHFSSLLPSVIIDAAVTVEVNLTLLHPSSWLPIVRIAIQ